MPNLKGHVRIGACLAIILLATRTMLALAAEPSLYFLLKWGSDVTADGAFNAPQGVAVDGSGNLYVADTYNNRIQKFDGNGNYIRKWGSYGAGNGAFREVWDVAVDGSGYVYVADPNNHLIQKFTGDGVFVSQFGGYGTALGKLSSPYGVAADGSGYIYVAERGNQRIQKFTSTGTPVTAWGSYGSGDNQFNNPWDVAVDSSGNVYVADQGNNRIVKFNSNGSFLLKWGTQGSGDGQLRRPTALNIDSSGNVYVADASNYRVQAFTNTGAYLWKFAIKGFDPNHSVNPMGVAPDNLGNIFVTVAINRVVKYTVSGTVLQQWGTAHSGDGQLASPRGIAVDSAGDVYVADQSNNRIQKFAGTGAFIAKWGVRGGAPGQLYNPYGVAIDPDRNMYVIDRGNNRIQKLSISGEPLSSWSTSGYITAIALDNQRNVYLANETTHRIEKLTSSGTPVTSWGSFGSGAGQFNRPSGIAISAAGEVYVADTGNYRVQKFSHDGAFVRMWGWGVQTNANAPEVCAAPPCFAGRSGTGQGQFLQIAGMAVDTIGDVYVVESSGPSTGFSKFSSEGVLLTRWVGGWGIGDGRFFMPQSIAVDASGNVYVSDTNNWRIQKFGNTTTGTNVTVSSTHGNTTTLITFANVSAAGSTMVTTSTTAPPVPAGFQLESPPTYYNVTTSATFNSAAVCITYDPAQYSDPSQLRLLHYETNSWVDVTASHDITNHKICGLVTTLSPFVVAQQVDSTAPVIVANISGSLGANGWYASAVTVNWSVTDPESGIKTSVGCGASNLTTDTPGMTLTCSATNGAGLSSSKPVIVKIDRTLPTISITNPQANKEYLRTATVNAAWTIGDSLSGVASQNGALDGQAVTNGQAIDLLLQPLGPHTVTVSALDKAGNPSTASVAFKVVTDVNSLMAAQARACELNWIEKKGPCGSLSAKLGAAKESIDKAKFDTAKHQLNAFLNELDALKGKGVNQQAYDLLKADALYVIGHVQ